MQIDLHDGLTRGVGGSPDGPAAAAVDFEFGEADRHGLVGESPAAWALRAAIEFAGRAPAHVLVHGPSGTGKELVARAIHAASARAMERGTTGSQGRRVRVVAARGAARAHARSMWTEAKAGTLSRKVSRSSGSEV